MPPRKRFAKKPIAKPTTRAFIDGLNRKSFDVVEARMKAIRKSTKSQRENGQYGKKKYP
jgi:hypothetical protein